MKYEIDKESGYLYVDRPNLYSSSVPLLYGFIPRTYSAEASAAFCMQQSGLKDLKGDGDPIDVIVLTDRSVIRGDILVDAYPIGGLRMIDGGETDDKILAVLKDDQSYGHIGDISEVPDALLKRIKHYFLSYKNDPDNNNDHTVYIESEYGPEAAYGVIMAGVKDYEAHYL